eukprot:COSAG01_NODE_33972_length_555_cov_2.447368_1_plen_32_part_01
MQRSLAQPGSGADHGITFGWPGGGGRPAAASP